MNILLQTTIPPIEDDWHIGRFSLLKRFLERVAGEDGNWDPGMGAPSFVSEPPGNALAAFPAARLSTERYVRNLALWLGS